jgi:ABC-type phosphate/phosphonate transport system substrate-binding protein
MAMQQLFPVSLLLTLTFIAGMPAQDRPAPEKRVFRVGISNAIFLVLEHRSSAEAVIKLQPMAELFSSATGLRPELQLADPDTLVEDLRQGRIQLAALPGIEYAWQGSKARELTPLVVAAKNDIRLQALLLVRSEAKTKTLAELKGKSLAMPKNSELHVHLFLQKLITDAGQKPEKFFAQSTKHQDTDAAIEDVISGKANAIVLDSQSWAVYQERKPERAKKLKALAQSAFFPTAVFLAKPETMPEGEVKQLQDGLLHAHEKPFCRQILNCCRISQFLLPNAEYQQTVQNIVKEFPQPTKPANFFRD